MMIEILEEALESAIHKIENAVLLSKENYEKDAQNGEYLYLVKESGEQLLMERETDGEPLLEEISLYDELQSGLGSKYDIEVYTDMYIPSDIKDRKVHSDSIFSGELEIQMHRSDFSLFEWTALQRHLEKKLDCPSHCDLYIQKDGKDSILVYSPYYMGVFYVRRNTNDSSSLG